MHMVSTREGRFFGCIFWWHCFTVPFSVVQSPTTGTLSLVLFLGVVAASCSFIDLMHDRNAAKQCIIHYRGFKIISSYCCENPLSLTVPVILCCFVHLLLRVTWVLLFISWCHSLIVKVIKQYEIHKICLQISSVKQQQHLNFYCCLVVLCRAACSFYLQITSQYLFNPSAARLIKRFSLISVAPGDCLFKGQWSKRTLKNWVFVGDNCRL